MAGSHLEQNAGRSLWAAAALLPVPQRGRADAQHRGKFLLRQPIPRANDLDLRPSEVERPRGRLLPAEDGSPFADAGNQIIEEIVVHGYSSRTIRASTLS